MKLDRLSGAAAMIVIAAWCGGAGAQSGTANGTIHLHMPGQAIHLHPIRRRAQEPAAEATGAPPPTGTEPLATAPTQQQTPAPAKGARKGGTSKSPAIPFNFGDEEATPPASGTEAGPPTSEIVPAAPSPHGASPSHSHASLTKRGAVLFSKGALDPSPTQFDGVKILAGDLATALESGGARVELDAYGGAPGDKSSDARRLSLRRALAVRQLLIDDGVPSTRIDVRAMGGADDKGPSDRVDVFVRAG